MKTLTFTLACLALLLAFVCFAGLIHAILTHGSTTSMICYALWTAINLYGADQMVAASFWCGK